MLKVIFYIVLATFVGDMVCHGFSVFNPLSDKEGYCKIHGFYIKEGETEIAPLGACGSIICEDAVRNTITGKGCAPVSEIGPECHESKEDLTKLYPYCCPKAVCDESNMI